MSSHLFTVHLLRNGTALCGFTTFAPLDWPSSHVWTVEKDFPEAKEHACSHCKAKLERERSSTLSARDQQAVDAVIEDLRHRKVRLDALEQLAAEVLAMKRRRETGEIQWITVESLERCFDLAAKGSGR